MCVSLIVCNIISVFVRASGGVWKIITCTCANAVVWVCSGLFVRLEAGFAAHLLDLLADCTCSFLNCFHCYLLFKTVIVFLVLCLKCFIVCGDHASYSCDVRGCNKSWKSTNFLCKVNLYTYCFWFRSRFNISPKSLKIYGSAHARNHFPAFLAQQGNTPAIIIDDTKNKTYTKKLTATKHTTQHTTTTAASIFKTLHNGYFSQQGWWADKDCIEERQW